MLAMTSIPDKYSREQKLLALIRDRLCGGNMAELARRIGKDASYVARLFYPADKKGAKGIGVEIMRASTLAFDLPPGFWDMYPETLEDWPAGKPWLGSFSGQARNSSSVRAAVECLAGIASQQRPTLRKNLGNLLVELVEHSDDPDVIEQTITDIERFFGPAT